MRLPAKLPQFTPFAYVRRTEPNVGRTFYADNVQREDVPVLENTQDAPEPIRQSRFAGIGRAPGTGPDSGINLAFTLNIASIQSVMEDSFLAGKVRPEFQVLKGNGNGGQLKWTERQNIDPGLSTPYGNRASIQGVPMDSLVNTAYGLHVPNRRRTI